MSAVNVAADKKKGPGMLGTTPGPGGKGFRGAPTVSIVTEPVDVIEFIFGPAFAAELESADAARPPAPPIPPYRRTTAPRPADAREVRSHLGEAAGTFEALAAADFDAPAPALPSMADWIEAEAQAVRAKGSELAWWLAERMDEIARECRVLRAETPDEFDARSDVMAEFHGGPR